MEKCEKTENISQTARLHKILSKDSGCKIGCMRMANGNFTSNEEEILSGLFSTHFPGNKATNEGNANPLRTPSAGDWKLANKIVNKKTLSWSIQSFAPFKTPGTDGIFPALLQKGRDILLPAIKEILTASLAFGYIPKAWRAVRVIFLPKPGKKTYEDFKSFRPISLTSFLLKTLEKLVDNYLRKNIFKNKPFHMSQHAYMRGRSTDTALHGLLGPIEDSVGAGEFALSVFLDIEGAFDNTSFDEIENVLQRKGVDDLLRIWIGRMLRDRVLSSELNDVGVCRVVGGGCPQGGILSPLLWNLTVDSLLKELKDDGYHIIGFADDVTILVRGKFLSTIYDRMQRALRTVERWCVEKKLSVNPNKTSLILFTKKTKVEYPKKLSFFNKELSETKTVKYLGLILDHKLSWRSHLDDRILKSCRTFGQCRRAVGREWGLKPKWIHWIFTKVVLPYLFYGSLFWYKRTKLSTVQKQLSHLQRMACLSMTGTMRSTPTAGLEAILCMAPLHILCEGQARKTALRLNLENSWNSRHENVGHSTLWLDMVKQNRNFLLPSDKDSKKLTTDRNFDIIVPTVNKKQRQGANDAVVVFACGSIVNGRAGSAFLCCEPGGRGGVSLGTETTAFQADIISIALAAQYCLQENFVNKTIKIYAQNKSAVIALEKWILDSKIIIDSYNYLEKISEKNAVSPEWSCDPMGKEVKKLSNEFATLKPIGPWPSVALPYKYHTNMIDEWIQKQHSSFWRSLKTCKDTKQFVRQPLIKRRDFLLNCSKTNLRLLCSAITGHCGLNKHLSKIKLCNSATCNACEKEEESAFHVVARCASYNNLRNKIFNKSTLQVDETLNIDLNKLLMFLKGTGRFTIKNQN